MEGVHVDARLIPNVKTLLCVTITAYVYVCGRLSDELALAETGNGAWYGGS